MKTTYRKDYTAPHFQIKNITLHVTLGEDVTLVRAKTHFVRHPEAPKDAPLILDGRNLELLKLSLNNASIDYQKDDETLSIQHVPDDFILETEVQIMPQDNTSLEGLYKVKNLFCTQCEAQGFRKITYYLDRPDVMSAFTTTIVADKSKYPVLLSNGNLIDQGELEQNQHFVTYEDPFKKPCYLFALVAGDLACLEDSFTTQSGKKVAIKLFVDKGDEDKTDFALGAIKRAMRWDEVNYGREYDLDTFMVVATHDFNMGAMENKGLNIFNSVYILANPETATDDDCIAIERVIGHEYFHNWTGNRITCRDWFQLSLKESLTVFRDATFSADMTSPGVVRIKDVNTLRSIQFPQDAGPMSHPVRPESYIEINNFYTVTIYEKGAEVIRMLWTLLGKEGFRRGMDCYFERFDGQAVTIDDFVQAHADANQVDLKQFMQWYSKAGTPILRITSDYDATNKQYSLTVEQDAPPYHLPLNVALIDQSGREICHETLSIKKTKEQFTFDNITQKPFISLLRDFSAPVKVQYDYSLEELAFLLAHDTDPFSRWDAGQQFSTRVIKKLLSQEANDWQLSAELVNAWKQILENPQIDPALAALLLTLPTAQYLIEEFAPVDLDKLLPLRKWLRDQLADTLHPVFLSRYQSLESNTIATRALKNQVLAYLGFKDNASSQEIIVQQLQSAKNMTDEIAALSAISHSKHPNRITYINNFYQKWKKETLVVDKWLSIQARSELPNTLETVKQLMTHPAFDIKNPNKVRSLIGAFTQNLQQFHALDGSGYTFLTEQIIKLHEINPMIAARLLDPFTRYKKYDEKRQILMRTALKEIQAIPNLAKDIYEIVEKSL